MYRHHQGRFVGKKSDAAPPRMTRTEQTALRLAHQASQPASYDAGMFASSLVRMFTTIAPVRL
jgi:hypothetical protein